GPGWLGPAAEAVAAAPACSCLGPAAPGQWSARACSGLRSAAGLGPACLALAGPALDLAYSGLGSAVLGPSSARADRAAEIDLAYSAPAPRVAPGLRVALDQRVLARDPLLTSHAPSGRRLGPPRSIGRRICPLASPGLTLRQILPITQPC